MPNSPLKSAANPIHQLLESNRNGRLLAIRTDLLDDNPKQPRTAIAKAPLEDLAETIRTGGLLQPITVRKVGARFQIIAGHRRAAAFRLLHQTATTDAERGRWAEIPAVEKSDVSDRAMHEFALVENLQREDLNPVELAASVADYQSTHSLSAADTAKALGLDAKRLQRLARLHGAPELVKVGVTKGLMVELGGEPPRREHRTLDLLGALEICRAWAHWQRADSKRAGPRTEKLIRRALEEGWAFRRIQAAVQDVLHRSDADDSSEEASSAAGGDASGPATPPTTEPCFRRTERQLVIYTTRLSDASPEERAALTTELHTLLTKLA